MLAASMIARAGSKEMRIDEIKQGALPDGGKLRRAGGQGDDDVHGVHPSRQLGGLRRRRAAHARSSPGSARGFPAPEGRAAERTRPKTSARTTRRSSARSGCRPTSSRARRTGTPCSAPSQGSRRSHSTTCKEFVRERVHAGEPDVRRHRATCPRTDRSAADACSRSCPPGPALPAPPGVAARKPEGNRGGDHREGHACDRDLLRACR